MSKESIIEKIIALKCKSEDSGCTEAEAEAFGVKVAQLMEKHAIEMHELSEPPEHEHDIRKVKYMNPWRRHLLDACADACFCTYVRGRGEKTHIVGRPLNVRACYEMFYFIESQVVLIARQLYSGRKSQRRAEGGLGDGIALKIMKSKMYDQESRLPVVQEKEAAEKAAMDALNFVIAPVRNHTNTIEHVVGRMNSGRIDIRGTL